MQRDKNKIRGCLLGGAIGDAFGYPVEFLRYEQIQERYGCNGILGYDLNNGYAEISDETQMSLFTANGLLVGKTRGCMKGGMAPYAAYLTQAYRDWYKTQNWTRNAVGQSHYCWLHQAPQLHHRRSPSLTCLQTLGDLQTLVDKRIGTIEQPINNAKGCGGIVRVAPIGAFFDPREMNQVEIDRLGAEATAITHGHPMAWLPAAALVHMINCIIYCGATHDDWRDLLNDTVHAMVNIFPKYSPDPMVHLLRRAVDLAASRYQDRDALHSLGDGQTATEALAMAVFCAIRHGEDFESSIIAAVNHDGDSNAVAAICGNLQGAILGLDRLPEYDLEPLELRELIDEIAIDLWTDCRMHKDSAFYDDEWDLKYRHAICPDAYL